MGSCKGIVMKLQRMDIKLHIYITWRNLENTYIHTHVHFVFMTSCSPI